MGTGNRRQAWAAMVLLGLLGCSGDDDGASGGGPGGRDVADSGFGNAPSPAGAGGAKTDGGALPPGFCGGCVEDGSGAASNAPFRPGTLPSDRVKVDADGALVLDPLAGTAGELIWIANTAEGTVSKIDTISYAELGRYEIPGVDWNINGDENGPSRTSVDSEGSVYAGARFGSGITKVSAAGEDCPDTNGDGAITTSAGANDVLAAGDDDCVLWTTDIAGDARGVAVQETPTQIIVDGPDADPRIVGGERFVWTGGQDVAKLHKLDAQTGAILLTLDEPPTPTYGLALDGRGNLWISGREWEDGDRRGALGRVDTTRCLDQSCADEEVCVTVCTETSCPDDCDDAVLERIELNTITYGITVDCAQRVWLGGAWGGDGVRRYDPLAPADARLSALGAATFTAVSPEPFDDTERGIHGIAADAAGFVWGAGHDTGVWRIDANTLDFVQVAGTGGEDWSAKGMAVDRRGRVWAIPLRQDYALLITPGPTLDDATVEKPVDGLVGPYTYSDMTGEQRRLAANEPGFYRQRFEGCAKSATTWGLLGYDVEAEGGTQVVFRVRTAANESDLPQAEWLDVAAIPGGNGQPIDLGATLEASGVEPERFLEVEVLLFAPNQPDDFNRCTYTPTATPRVKSFTVQRVCATEVG